LLFAKIAVDKLSYFAKVVLSKGSDLAVEKTAQQIDYDNGYAGYYAGAPIRYYGYSGAAYRGWKAAQFQHWEDMDACDAAGYPQD
jgi:hypothetical protein